MIKDEFSNLFLLLEEYFLLVIGFTYWETVLMIIQQIFTTSGNKFL